MLWKEKGELPVDNVYGLLAYWFWCGFCNAVLFVTMQAKAADELTWEDLYYSFIVFVGGFGASIVIGMAWVTSFRGIRWRMKKVVWKRKKKICNEPPQLWKNTTGKNQKS